MDLPTKIRLARKRADLTQAELGKKLGVGQSAVSQWETGETRPDVRKSIELSEALKLPLSDLLPFSGDASELLTADHQTIQLVHQYLKLPPAMRTAVLLHVLGVVEALGLEP